MAAGVLFDVDGTLVDTNYLHAVTWHRAFADLGVFVATATIHHHIGMGSDKLVPAVAGREVPGASDRHGELYRELHDQLDAFPKAADILRAVHDRGVRVVLATSAKQEDVDALLKAIDADDAIDHVTSSGDVDDSKPDPDIFAVACEAAGLDADRTVVVGDTVWDVEAAARLGLPCVAVLTGGIAEERLRDAGAAAVYDDVADLLARLDESPLAALWAG